MQARQGAAIRKSPNYGWPVGSMLKKISAVIFDLDGTLTKVPSPWRYVHERLGVWESRACSYFDEWQSGRINYEEFCHRDTSLWSGYTVEEIYSYLDEIALNRHVPDVIETLTAARIPSI